MPAHKDKMKKKTREKTATQPGTPRMKIQTQSSEKPKMKPKTCRRLGLNMDNNDFLAVHKPKKIRNNIPPLACGIKNGK